MQKRFMLVVAALVALAAPGLAQADTVTEWNLNAANVLMVNAGQAPNVSVLHMAMVHGAVYDSVNAIDDGYEGYLLSSRVGQPSDSKEAAAATAAYRVLLHLQPAQQALLDAQYAASLAGIPAGSQKNRGIAVGEAAAAAMIAARMDDGRFGAFRFAEGLGVGVWRRVPPTGVDPNSWVKDVRPFLIPAPFASRGPDPLTSSKYAREFAEVKSLGRDTSTARTADQTHAARYWAENPPLTWSRVLRKLSGQQGLSLVDNARMYATLYLTVADTFITVWHNKALWSFWRPETAIQNADLDGNPATEKDATWKPLLANPPYPEHPSGHLGLSGAVLTTLQMYLRTDRIGWTDTNNAGLTRSFTRFSQALDEIVGARIWSGIHFRNADETSVEIARQIALYRALHYFRPERGRMFDD